MAKKKITTSLIAGTAGIWVTRILMLILGMSLGVFLGVALLAKVVWELIDTEVDGVVVSQEGNKVTVRDSNGQENTWELEFKKGVEYEFDGTFQGNKITITDVDVD